MKAHTVCSECSMVCETRCDGCEKPTCDRHLNNDGAWRVCWSCLTNVPSNMYKAVAG